VIECQSPLIYGQLAWDLGNGVGFSYVLGAFIKVHDSLAWDSTSISQRFAFSYTGEGWNVRVFNSISLGSLTLAVQRH
jgi:Putative MetA-pathway of phenol degradation